mmetsp:Transcript_2542/g.3937  ORF Transcript_2542/g.3937 Transcript_2542/m.3937 type:complete len:122 (+) Transcript_2542:3-368(+)
MRLASPLSNTTPYREFFFFFLKAMPCSLTDWFKVLQSSLTALKPNLAMDAIINPLPFKNSVVGVDKSPMAFPLPVAILAQAEVSTPVSRCLDCHGLETHQQGAAGHRPRSACELQRRTDRR